MSEKKDDWDPRGSDVLDNPLAAYDELRRSCPVARSDYLGWSVFSHSEVKKVLLDHDTFSSAVSARASVPNGMDPPLHTGYREIIDPYFNADSMARFEPICRHIARDLTDALPANGEVEIMSSLAHPFALNVQCAFTGWPLEWRASLQHWVERNQSATLSGDRALMREVAAEFQGWVHTLVEQRRDTQQDGVISRLTREKVRGRPLNLDEIVSILRNWTVGELGTIAASIGIIALHLSRDQTLQKRLRTTPELIPAAVEEILRVEGPLLSNRRIATRPVQLGQRCLEKGDRITVMWASANRDENAFEEATTVRLERDQSENLLYGTGIHVCPGAPLARLELKVVTESLLKSTSNLSLSSRKPPVQALYPAAGYMKLWVDSRRDPVLPE